MELISNLLDLYRLKLNKGPMVMVLQALDKYHPTAIERASEIMLRNEDYFSVKKLCDIIDTFNLQPKEMEKPNIEENWPSPWERAGMTLVEWETKKEESAYEDDLGAATLERMQNDPESFQVDWKKDD